MTEVRIMKCQECYYPIDKYDYEEGQCRNCGRKISIIT